MVQTLELQFQMIVDNDKNRKYVTNTKRRTLKTNDIGSFLTYDNSGYCHGNHLWIIEHNDITDTMPVSMGRYTILDDMVIYDDIGQKNEEGSEISKCWTTN